MLVQSLALILALSRASVSLSIAPPLAPPHAVTVIATDYHLAIPATLPPGPTTFTIVNRGREAHHLQLERLEQGHSLAELLAALKSGGRPPAWAVDVGGPNAVDPGGRSLPATVDLRPGTYAALCVIPGPDAVPHAMKGMAQQFTVRGSSAPPAHFLGGVTAIAPGQTNVLSLALTPGRYALLCFVPDAKDGKPHVAHGMMRDVEIAGSTRTSARR